MSWGSGFHPAPPRESKFGTRLIGARKWLKNRAIALGGRCGGLSYGMPAAEDRLRIETPYRQSPNSSNAAQWKGWEEPDLPRI